MDTLAHLEVERVALQRECDNARTQKERNRLGQFATPPALAREIMKYAKKLIPVHEKVRFLDPAFGTGSFFSALLETIEPCRVSAATGFEIDRHYADRSRDLWRENRLDLRTADFTIEPPPRGTDKFNLLVCNPPYVRHHHLTPNDKTRLRSLTQSLSGFKLSGLSGLYCYFLLLSDAWVSDDGVCIWLVPSEFMDVNYGFPLKEYLLTKVTLLRIHRFDSQNVQFGDALVSSSIVCFRKASPQKDHAVDFTFGGSLNDPRLLQKIPLADLRSNSKWNERCWRPSVIVPATRLSDLFYVKRGLATGDNAFFILTREQIKRHRLPMKFFKPILPSPRFLSTDEIQADKNGNPLLERRVFLLDCRLPEGVVQRDYPRLWKYLEQGKKNDVAKGYLCSSRTPWYSQENRPAPLFLCTYMGRSNRKKSGAALRFILNHSMATAANVYLLLYPKTELGQALLAKPQLKKEIWTWLNSIAPDVVLGEGRLYGGGLHKIEPRELGNVPADGIEKLLNITIKKKSIQLNFFASDENSLKHAVGT
jgi:adenine-specific DNA-methyltransferase